MARSATDLEGKNAPSLELTEARWTIRMIKTETDALENHLKRIEAKLDLALRKK